MEEPRFPVAGMVLAGVLFARITCLANPTGGVVVNGDALIQNIVPGLTTIVQSTDRAVIDWQSFSIGAGERANFIVPNATSATLNRVLGYDPSILNGTLTSNGHVFLINSNGIVFGQGSMVDVAGLTASTLNIGNGAFMAGGEMLFSGNSEARVRNAGVIKASSGDVFLIGYQVSNSGTIRAPNGTVGLAAGSEVLIRPVGDERVVVRTASGSHKKYGVSNSGVIEANVAEIKAHGGNVYALAIRNTGRVAATGVTTQGGRILLKADGGKIKNSGTLVARGTAGNGGRIMVDAGRKGSVNINGRVDADGPGGAGGKIVITGEKVEIRRAVAVTADGKNAGGQIDIGSDAPAGTDEAAASQTLIAGRISAGSSQGTGGEIRLGGNLLTLQCGASISANGSTGGGQIFAGGGWTGAESRVLDSTCVTVEDGALLTANALHNGDGGRIVVAANDSLVFQGVLQALGGAQAGDGGVAELRAGKELSIDQISGCVDLSAACGRAGSLLLLSSEWEISNRCLGVVATNSLNAEDVGNFLNSANLTIQTAVGNAGGSGNVVLSGTVVWNSTNALTINAACDFQLIEKAGDAGVIDAQSAGGVTINTGRFVSLETGTSIRTGTGDVLINANQQLSSDPGQAGIILGGDITTGGGNVSLTGVGVTSTGGTVNAGSGTILIDATTAKLGNITTGTAGTVVLGEAGGDNLSGTVTQTGAINAGTVTGNGGSTVTLDGSNTVVNLGDWQSADEFVFKDTSGGLNVTGDVETRGGAASISTAGGALALGDRNVTTNDGSVSLAGAGVTSTGGAVNAGGGTILIDGNDGAVNLAGALTTSNETATAVRVIDATTTKLGNITTGAAGTVVLGEAGGDNLSGAVTQTGAINAGTVTGNTGSTVTLDGSNTVVNLGDWQSTDAFVFKDTSGGLNVIGDVETRGGAAMISTAGGALALGGSNVTSNGGNVSLAGTGVTSTGGRVNAGSGTILVDGNDGAVNLAGALTTTNGTTAAVRVIDVTTVTLGNVTAAGTVVLGEAGADGLSGAVTQTGTISAAGLILAGDGDFTLTATTNAIGTVATLGAVGSLALENSIGLTIGRIDTAGGVSVAGDIRISSVNGMVIRENVISQGGIIDLSASSFVLNGATIASAGGAAVTLTGSQFTLTNQPIIQGVLQGTGGAAQLVLTESNLTQGMDYIIEEGKISAGSRSYTFQNMSALRIDFGSGNDRAATDYFSFTQVLNGGGGTNQLLVAGIQQTVSPLAKLGFGSISFSGFSTTQIVLDGTPFGSLLLQSVAPGGGGGGGGGGSSQTNNFSGTSVGGAAGLAGALGATGGSTAAVTSGLLSNVTATMGQNLGFVSAGGGAPPSLNAQSQMSSATSAAVESELNAALGGDGTMGVRSSTGLVSVNPQGPPPNAGTVAQLDASMGLAALSELSFGVFGVSEVTLNNQFGAQALNLGGAPPSSPVRQKMAQIASPESFSTLSASLGGDGIARVESASGVIAMDLQGLGIPFEARVNLMGIISVGSLGELMLALGGTGESVVNDSHGLVSMHAAGTAPGVEVASAILAMLSATDMSRMSLMLDGNGAGLMQPEDGIQSAAFDAAQPGPFVKAHLADATSPQSVEELDHAAR